MPIYECKKNVPHRKQLGRICRRISIISTIPRNAKSRAIPSFCNGVGHRKNRQTAIVESMANIPYYSGNKKSQKLPKKRLG